MHPIIFQNANEYKGCEGVRGVRGVGSTRGVRDTKDMRQVPRVQSGYEAGKRGARQVQGR